MATLASSMGHCLPCQGISITWTTLELENYSKCKYVLCFPDNFSLSLFYVVNSSLSLAFIALFCWCHGTWVMGCIMLGSINILWTLLLGCVTILAWKHLTAFTFQCKADMEPCYFDKVTFDEWNKLVALQRKLRINIPLHLNYCIMVQFLSTLCFVLVCKTGVYFSDTQKHYGLSSGFSNKWQFIHMLL